MGIINSIFGSILNLIFEGIVTLTPVGTLGISIIIFTLVTRLLLTPLQLSQQRTTRALSRVQPELQKLQNKYKNKTDQASQLQYSQEMRAIYKKYKINPAAGCLPLLIQFPLIIALFNVLREPARYITRLGEQYHNIADTIMQNVPNYTNLLEGFKATVASSSRAKYDISQVGDLANFLSHLKTTQWDELLGKLPTGVQPLIDSALTQKNQMETFFGVNLVDTPDLLFKSGMWFILIIPILTGASTYIFSKITMASNASMQKAAASSNGGNTAQASSESMMKTMNVMMPIMTLMFSYTMPIGLSVYWIAGNIIMMGQQWGINKVVDKQYGVMEEQIKKEQELAKMQKKSKKAVKKSQSDNEEKKPQNKTKE